MKYSEKSTWAIADDLIEVTLDAATLIISSPLWVPYYAAAICLKEAAKLYEHHKENRGEPKNHNHHSFNLFHHSKDKENQDAQPVAQPVDRCASPAYQN